MALKDKLAVAAALATMATANAQKVQPDSKDNKPKTEKVTKARPKTVTKAKTAEVEIPEEEIQTTEEVNQSITQVVSTYPTSVQYSVPAPDKIALDHSHMEVSKAYLGYVKGMMNKAIEKEGSLEIYNLYKGEGGRTVSTVITKGNYDGVYNTSSYIGDPTDASAGKIDIHGEGKYGSPELGKSSAIARDSITHGPAMNTREPSPKTTPLSTDTFLMPYIISKKRICCYIMAPNTVSDESATPIV